MISTIERKKDMAKDKKLKQCSKCKVLKPYKEFGKDKTKKDGHASQCKICSNERHRKYYEKNKELIRQSNKSGIPVPRLREIGKDPIGGLVKLLKQEENYDGHLDNN